MQRSYLGDSYDMVKRFWAKTLRPIAPLYADPQFIPNEIRRDYKAATTIPLYSLEKPPEEAFGLLFDPDTGIPLDLARKVTVAHCPISYIIRRSEELKPTYMICFDQSHHRGHDELDAAGQIASKIELFRVVGLNSFYYHSHARFFFISSSEEVLENVRAQLTGAGVPRCRFRPPYPKLPENS